MTSNVKFSHILFSYLHCCSSSLFYEVKQLRLLKNIDLFTISRSQQMFFEICVLKNLLKNFIKKDTPTQVFSVKFSQFLRTPFFTEHLRWLLLSFLKQKSKNEKIFSRKYIHKKTPVIVLFLVQLQA